MRTSLLPGVQRPALGGAAAAARGRLPFPPSCLAALRSRLLLLLFFLFLLGVAIRSRFSSAYPTAAGTTTGQTSPDPRAETRPASARERDAHHDLASPRRPRVRRSSSLPMFGGVHDAPGREKHPDAIELARFAVAEHNSKTNAALEFVSLVKVRMQLVAGTMNYLTIEVREVDGGGASKLYEAKVWLRLWQKFKGLQAFEPVADAA